MSGEISSTFSCDECADEPPVTVSESFHKLACHIGITTNFMRDGLLSSFTEKVEKKSVVLQRNAVWTKTSRVKRLPKYLVIHFMRVYWIRVTSKPAKIFRRVRFPFQFDATEFCMDQLKKKMLHLRDEFREAQHQSEQNEWQTRRLRHEIMGTDVVEPTDISRMMVHDESEEQAKVDTETLIDRELKGDVGSNPTGLYELSAVWTHAGPNSYSGHWQGWTKQVEGSMFLFLSVTDIRWMVEI
jgi:ubiquitin carboxyl-terminal hydrolase 14